MAVDTAALINALFNIGGMGIVAAVLFYLHITTLKSFEKRLDDQWQAFREELAEERRQCHEDHQQQMTGIQRNHDLLIGGNACRAGQWMFKGFDNQKQP